jgi:geranylgeranyl diphosphate synthase, type II
MTMTCAAVRRPPTGFSARGWLFWPAMGLLTEAFHLLSSAEARRDAGTGRASNSRIGAGCGRRGFGRRAGADLEAEKKTVDLARVEMIQVRKTGALILAALRIGAQVAKATSADLAWLSRYGEYLGLAFQIADDILDSHSGGVEHGSRVEPQGAEAGDPLVVGIVVARERLRKFLSLSLVDLETFGARGRARGAC